MGGGDYPQHVLFALPLEEPAGLLNYLRLKYPKLTFTFKNISKDDESGSSETLAKKLPESIFKEVTVLVTFSSFPQDPRRDAPILEYIQLFSAGSNQIQQHPVYTQTDVTIATASGVHGPQIAEWVLMTALIQGHRYKQLYESQKKHEWGPQKGNAYDGISDVVGKRLGVLGYGSIGRQVARVVKAMGMDVIAYTATPKDTPEKRRDTGYIVPGTGDQEGVYPSKWYSGTDKKSLHHFLSQDIDLLLVSVPLTKDTRHMISTEEFNVLSHNGKKSVYVTNIARGPIIDQPALISALKDKTIAGANLDVTDPEPLPADSELWDMQNVIVTPHISASGMTLYNRVFDLFDQQLERRQKGQKLINVVQRKRGY